MCTEHTQEVEQTDLVSINDLRPGEMARLIETDHPSHNHVYLKTTLDSKLVNLTNRGRTNIGDARDHDGKFFRRLPLGESFTLTQ